MVLRCPPHWSHLRELCGLILIAQKARLVIDGDQMRLGDNIGGIAVHIAARINAEAEASEVMISSTTKDLVAGSEIVFEWTLFTATA